jgi:glycosyltransferase involved in cell wall biosynthesis
MHLPGGGEVQLLKYKEYLKAQNCDVVLHDIWHPRFNESMLFHHFHLVSGGIPFLDCVRKLGMQVVLSPNLWINETNQSNINTQEIQTFYNLADHIVCNSEVEIDNLELHSGLPRHKAHVIHNGVDPWFCELVNPTIFKEWSGVEGAYLLNVANIEHRKNQLGAVRAASVIGLPLVSIGRVRDQSYFELCIKEGQGKYFIHLGALAQSDERLRAAYQGCAAFILPSTLETPGIAALEAAASGARVVITSEGSAYEYFQDEAFYVNPQDQDSIVTAIAQALNSPSNPLLQIRIIEQFSWHCVTAELLNFYSERQGSGGR